VPHLQVGVLLAQYLSALTILMMRNARVETMAE
jgi:hypothetical protein